MDVINHVLAVGGVFIYGATSARGGGHAFAFDMRGRAMRRFFDPNQGEWRFDDASDDEIRAWWKRFWDATRIMGDSTVGTIDYKSDFHHGKRVLWEYKVAPGP